RRRLQSRLRTSAGRRPDYGCWLCAGESAGRYRLFTDQSAYSPGGGRGRMRSTAARAPIAPALPENPSPCPWGRRLLRRFMRRRLALIGAVIIVVFTATALGAPWLAPYNPQATNWAKIRKPADAHNWLGTDDLGRDELSRVIWGAQVSLLAGV